LIDILISSQSSRCTPIKANRVPARQVVDFSYTVISGYGCTEKSVRKSLQFDLVNSNRFGVPTPLLEAIKGLNRLEAVTFDLSGMRCAVLP
jgi:hypothetical protein